MEKLPGDVPGSFFIVFFMLGIEYPDRIWPGYFLHTAFVVKSAFVHSYAQSASFFRNVFLGFAAV